MPPREPESGGGHPNEPADNAAVDVDVACPTPRPNPRHLPHATAVFPVVLKFEEVVIQGEGGPQRQQSPRALLLLLLLRRRRRRGRGGGGGPAERMILKGITGVVCPGEMLAMLGPSGSRETTLGGRRLASNLSGKIIQGWTMIV